MSTGSCTAPALFAAALSRKSEQALGLGSGHSTSVAWEGLLSPGPGFQQ